MFNVSFANVAANDNVVKSISEVKTRVGGLMFHM